MIVSQQEIEVFRAVLANRPEYNDAQEALNILSENDRDLVQAYPFLDSAITTRGNHLDDLEKLAQVCWEKCRDQLEKVDRTRFVHDSVEAVFHIVLAYAIHAGITQGIVVGIVFILLKQKF